MTTCGRPACPAEQAWAAQQRAARVLIAVLLDMQPFKATQWLDKIAKEHGQEFADAIRADLNSAAKVRV